MKRYQWCVCLQIVKMKFFHLFGLVWLEAILLLYTPFAQFQALSVFILYMPDTIRHKQFVKCIIIWLSSPVNALIWQLINKWMNGFAMKSNLVEEDLNWFWCFQQPFTLNYTQFLNLNGESCKIKQPNHFYLSFLRSLTL